MKVKFFQINIFKFDLKKNKDQKQPGRKYGKRTIKQGTHMSLIPEIFLPSKQREAIMIKFDKDKVTNINHPIGPCDL